MKEPSEVFIEVNINKAMTSTEHQIPFFKSLGNIILSEGAQDGTIPL
jgi:hypothetical protein